MYYPLGGALGLESSRGEATTESFDEEDCAVSRERKVTQAALKIFRTGGSVRRF